MAKTATYTGPWDSHKFSKADLGGSKGYTFPRGEAVEVAEEDIALLEATGENFTFDEVEDVDEENEAREAENPGEGEMLTDDNGGGEAAQTGDAIAGDSTTTTAASTSGSTGTSTVSGSTGSGRASSRRSSR